MLLGIRFSEERRMKNDEWRVKSEEWKMKNEEWRMISLNELPRLRLGFFMPIKKPHRTIGGVKIYCREENDCALFTLISSLFTKN